MSNTEAKHLVEEIVSGARLLAAKLQELRDRMGWKALGYDSWAECVTGEFGYSKRHANRLIAAQETRVKLGPIGPTEAPDGGEVPESHARELGRLRDDHRADCYADYIDECEQQKTKPTAAGLREKVETWLADNEPYVDVGDDDADDQLRDDGGDQVGPADPQHDDGRVVAFDVTAESAETEDCIRQLFRGWPAEHRQFIPSILY